MRSILTNFAFLFLLLSSPMAVAWTLQGQVVAIVNGDTIRVRDERKVQHTVRLAGIDAPEKFQKHAQRSEDALREFVFQKYVTVEVPRQGGSPRLGKVVVAGRDVGLELLADGAAWYDPSRAQDLAAQDRQAYAAAQADARERRAGLWRDSKPIPPWDYRAGRRK
ncbi:thermonuclease family protein [Curvibacter sp. PAE-UM]|uniref:thermonuclease family protein n=1 Tax=Curvibacter sp. PAE-UM TaxID=1714344 RepID=UPI0009EB591A|nr:thermonuclease family protein [Curvibacter sp. PAE-UM]